MFRIGTVTCWSVRAEGLLCTRRHGPVIVQCSLSQHRSDDSLVVIHQVVEWNTGALEFLRNERRFATLDLIAATWSSHSRVQLTVTPRSLYFSTRSTVVEAMARGTKDSLLNEPSAISSLTDDMHMVQLWPIKYCVQGPLHVRVETLRDDFRQRALVQKRTSRE